MKSPLENIVVVCARPMYGGNMGSICRAMMNMGLSRLRIVQAREDMDQSELRMMAKHAIALYDEAEHFSTIGEALADCVAVAATSARAGFYRDTARTLSDTAPLLLDATASGPVALLFGPEDKGLSNDELKLATHIIRIPTSPEYSSINLSQAVLLCAYELYNRAGDYVPPSESSPIADNEFRERMFEAWREAMLDIRFSKEDKLEHMMMGLRRILSRAPLTTNDVKILMGLARQSSWASKQGKGEQAD